MKKPTTAARKDPSPTFKNVAVLLDDHAMLSQLAKQEQRSMARQLSVLIRKAFDEMNAAA